MGGSASHIHLRFATASFIVVFVIGALAALGAMYAIERSEEDATARSARQLVAAPLRSVLDPALSGGDVSLSATARQAVDSFSQPVVAGDVEAVHVWSADGNPIYSAGIDAGPAEAASPNTHPANRRTSAGDGTALYSTYVDGDGYVIEVAQDGGALDARIQGREQNALLIDGGAMIAVFLLLQGVFWFATRGISVDHKRLVSLYLTGADLRSSLDLHEVLSRVASESTASAQGDYGLVALYEPETGDMLLRVTYDHSNGTVTHHQRAVEEWFLRRCVATNTTIVSAQNASAYIQILGPEMTLDGQVNVLCAPMCIRDRVVGVVAVIKKPVARGAAFAPVQVRQSLDIAIQGAMAIEQSQLFAKVRAYADEVELSYDATLKALMAALDAKDDVTEGHCERVARLTVQLARQIGVSDASLVDIERGAMLHDVGKIGVPDAVLKKPAALDDMEWEAIRKHPLLAGMMISKVGFLEGATPILLYHHERFDGTGYPFGLISDKIPLDARIFSVVDAYDAMTSDRPYRDAMPHAVAMEEIRAGSGSQFDPVVVVQFDHLMTSRPELRTRTPHARETLHTDDPASHAA